MPKKAKTKKEKRKKEKKKRDRRPFLYRFAAVVTRIIACPLFWNRYLSKNVIPKEGAFVAAGNHISLCDPVFLTLANRRPIRYMAKQELFRKRITRFFCKSFGAFPVNRGGADIRSVNQAVEWLKTGKVFGIFVEGHRQKTIEVKNGKAGAVFIAHRAGAPIVPFAVYTKRQNKLRLFCKYTAIFGDPITVEELGVVTGSSSEYRKATRKLMRIIIDLQDECAAARSGKRRKKKEK